MFFVACQTNLRFLTLLQNISEKLGGTQVLKYFFYTLLLSTCDKLHTYRHKTKKYGRKVYLMTPNEYISKVCAFL